MMPVDSFSIQSGKWPSPHELPSSFGLPHRTFAEWVYQVKNEPVDFDSKPKPPCESSAKRTLMAVLRKLVGVFQRKQSSQISSQGQPTSRLLDIGSTGLIGKKPQTKDVLRYFEQLIKDIDILWAEITHGKPELLYDQVARRSFNREMLEVELANKSPMTCALIAINFEGKYGNHLRGILTFAAKQIEHKDPVQVSIIDKYASLIEDLIIVLDWRLFIRNKSVNSLLDIPYRTEADLHCYSEPTSKDIEALSAVGIVLSK